ncbi:helix-turn-helix transcriptional regulator [Patulibacter sp.]|uniref:helix-turn-helix transcriptional regulator n=1 Tax=Patulibacter sp. TaxID=1912859 RepID=UPI00271C3952|nr:helix-turn-helix transcriptional regulator [Patulibacter sp.]MDO9408737.1 helix-turn-helix transcriptional regulator [Patulibacter sp.]
MHDLDDRSPATAAPHGWRGAGSLPDRPGDARHRGGRHLAAVPAPTTDAPPHRPLSRIALQRTRHDVLRTALGFARDAWGADGAFAATRRVPGVFPVDVRVGLDAPCWTGVVVRSGRGMGGRVIEERGPRTSDDYLQDASITADYVPIMRRESVRATAVVPVEDLSGGTHATGPAALLYVTSRDVGAPGDRVLVELLRIADMAAVGLAHLGETAPDPLPVVETSLTPRELELLELLARGCSNRQIAEDLVISPSTVKAHLGRIYRKLGEPSRLAAVAAARRAGLV